MDLLACGHAAHLGDRLICAHLVGEHADAVDKVWLMRGIGLQYDLCCIACEEADAPVELIAACEGCVSNADNTASKVVGAPQVLRRPEAFDATITASPLPMAVTDIAAVDDLPVWWMLLAGDRLISWNADTHEINAEWTVGLPGIEPARNAGKPPRLRLLAAPDGRFAAIVADHHQYGVVIDMATGRTSMRLDRGTYHFEQTAFPAAFVRLDGQLLIAHATAWNRIDLSDPSAGITITTRTFEVPEGEKRPLHNLDYFYGALHPSPSGEWLAADGWVWAPVGMPRLCNMRDWRYHNVYETEDGESVRRLRWVDYHWNVPMCWLDDESVAISGIGSDDLAMIHGVEIFDTPDGNLRIRFAGPRGTLFAAGSRLYSSDPDGLSIWDPETGEQTGHLPGFKPTHTHRGGQELVVAEKNQLLRWSTTR